MARLAGDATRVQPPWSARAATGRAPRRFAPARDRPDTTWIANSFNPSIVGGAACRTDSWRGPRDRSTRSRRTCSRHSRIRRASGRWRSCLPAAARLRSARSWRRPTSSRHCSPSISQCSSATTWSAASRVGNAVYYELAHPKISELLLIARTFLADTLAARRDRARCAAILYRHWESRMIAALRARCRGCSPTGRTTSTCRGHGAATCWPVSPSASSPFRWPWPSASARASVRRPA